MPKRRVTRIGILGGGPAGLSMAKLLSEEKGIEPVVIEIQKRIGGKSDTISQAGMVAELGTCYATLGHKQTNRWMRELGISKFQIGEQHYDGTDFIQYVKKGGGAPLLLQVLRYHGLRRKLLSTLDSGRASEKHNLDAAMPVKTWLDRRGLNKIERFMHRALSSMGYGYVDTTPTVQALRWCDWDLMWSGVINQLYGPKVGWYEFWRQLSAAFEVHVGVTTETITRHPDKVVLETSMGTMEFDYLVSTIPPDELLLLTDPTPTERQISASIDWVGYSSALIAADDWFTEWQTEGYSEAILAEDRASKIVAARFEGHFPDLGGNVYFVGHALEGFTPDELREILTSQLQEKGANLVSVLHHRNWKYFPKYQRSAIEDGLIASMVQMQGDKRTYYSGSAYSHDAVSSITRFNARLIRERIMPQVRNSF